MKNLILSLVIILLCINFVFAINDFDSYKPYLHKANVGDVPKLDVFGNYKTEIFPGAGTYSYEIDIPIGVVGLQPSLSLFYNSQTVLQRPGIIGAGWSLSENNIMRNVNHTVNDVSDDYFVLTLGDIRTKLLYNGTNWKMEFNPNQVRVENFSNATQIYWNVTTTDGTRFRFGFNNNSLLESNSGKSYDIKWSLDLVEDVHGNKIFYSYNEDPFSQDQGAVYLSNIIYNNDQLRLITFDYENQNREDLRVVYEQGNNLSESRRLNNIYIYFNNSLVRRYKLSYNNISSEKSLTSLMNISYIGSDNSSILNTVKFDYYETLQGFDNTTNKWIVPSDYAFSSQDITGKDFGVRLLDVNNDGFIDLVKAKNGNRDTKLNNKIDGWEDTSLFDLPLDIVDINNVDQGVRFEDINSDGLVDILKAKDSSKAVYLNDGIGWYNATINWSIPVDFISSNKDLGVEFADINGDGKVDILKANTTIKSVYINNGTAWLNSSEWILPDSFINSDGNDSGLRLVDLNNDGLPDLIKGGIPGSSWFNNGSGWSSNSLYAPNLEFVDISGSRPDLGVRFMELNGDGLIDLVQNFYSNVSIINQTCVNQGNTTEQCVIGQDITTSTNTKINNGTGWVSGIGWNIDQRFTDEGYNIGRRIADVNGDGLSDIVVAYSGPPVEYVTHIKNSTSAFLLKKVTNAYGGITQIGYNQSTFSNNNDDLGFNVWVVGNTTLNNPLTGEFAAGSNYSYLYVNGKFNYPLQEFVGFGNVNETLPDNSKITHYFHQDNVLKGREFKTSIYDSLNNLMRESVNTFTNSNDNMIYLNESSNKIYDVSITPAINNVSFTYDIYGNLLIINNSGFTDVFGDEKLEIFGYVYNTSAFIIGNPVNYTLYGSDGVIVVNQKLYFYDNISSGVNKGDLTKLRNINNIGGNPETDYSYDSYGNLVREVNPLGNQTLYNYDSGTNTFLNQTINALGHIINYSYDSGTGNLLSEARHGLNRSYEYDIFGRIKKEIISPDSSSSPTKNYTYNLDGSAPETIEIGAKNNNSDYSDVIFVYDGFSNLVQTRTIFNSGNQIVKNYFYDSKYRIDEEQNPYLETYSSTLSSPINGSKVRYTYDVLDRVINLTNQNNNSIVIVYNKTTVTQYDENNNRTDYIIDVYDRIKNVSEYNGTTVFNTSYGYRVDNILLNITDSKNNLFIFGYDNLGRRTSYDDPNMNIWDYSYDLNGNIVNQTDGRNITTNITYDKLNRIVFKKAGNSNITFVYDVQFNGTLSNITSDSNYFDVVNHSYTYDNRLRVIKEHVYYCYRDVGDEPGPHECEFVNYSVDYDSQDRILNLYFPNQDLSYNYNKIGKINSIPGFLNSANYNSFGKIQNKTYNNNLVTTINYDEISRIFNLQTGNIQNLTYTYDLVGNIKTINDTANSKDYVMKYDSLNRLIDVSIIDTMNFATQRFTYLYDSIGNLLRLTTNDKEINLSYSNTSLVHTPTSFSETSRDPPRIELTTIYPTQEITVNKSTFFNYTTQVCCKDNDCGGINVTLDPPINEKTYTPSTETICNEGLCNKIIYSESRFAFEDNEWKNITEARSLKSIWDVEIDEDPEFPVQIIDYNYTTIILNLSTTDGFRLFGIPLKVYNRFDNTKKPTDEEGNVKDKDRSLRIGKNDWEIVTIDLSDTQENLLSQTIKWGDASTLIMINDTNSNNLGDAYIDNNSASTQHGTTDNDKPFLEIENSSLSFKKILIKFNLSNIPSQALIEDADLYLYLGEVNLENNENYIVSIHNLFHNYTWYENVTWNTGPNSSHFNSSFSDNIQIIGSGANGWHPNFFVSWDVTPTIKLKNSNESFYLVGNTNNGGESGDDIRFWSVNHSGSDDPYLNITYLLKGTIPMNSSETPFYTNISNPYFVYLEEDQCQNIIWWVNATGEERDYIFFTYANKTSDSSVYNESTRVIININDASNDFYISTCQQLQNMQNNLDGDYTLINNIDCSATTGWNSGLGFKPIGNSTNPFTGSLNGNNYVISNLYVNRTTEEYVGLFGYVVGSNMSNIGVINLNVSGLYYTGGLAGYIESSNISNSYATGNVSGGNFDDDDFGDVGGLIGQTWISTISNSYSTANVRGTIYTGGLIGESSTTNISNSYSTGNVNGSSITGGQHTGGLIGSSSQYTNISNSYSTGNVSGTISTGGLIGSTGPNPTRISNSYATGNVSGTTYIGGLIGFFNSFTNISNTYWDNHSGTLPHCWSNSTGNYNINCTAIQNDINYFKGDVYPNNEPMRSWSFFSVWQERTGDYPSLTWQGIGTDIPDSGPVKFIDPTPNHNVITTNTSVRINTSIEFGSLKEVIFNWNSTNYTLFDDSVASMYNFDNRSSLGENSTRVVDVSENGKNGTVINAVFNSSGKYNGAYTFDWNGDYISENSQLVSSYPFTMSAWVTKTGSSGGIIFFIESDNPEESTYYGIGATSVGKIYANPGDTPCSASGSTSINDGKWHNILGVFNSDTDKRLYIDGKNEASITSALCVFPPFFSVTRSIIGYSAPIDQYFNGTIDEVIFINRSLNSSEVQELYFSNLYKYNQTQWYLYVNQSKNSTAVLSNGIYNYQVFGKNSTSYIDSTDKRVININV